MRVGQHMPVSKGKRASISPCARPEAGTGRYTHAHEEDDSSSVTVTSLVARFSSSVHLPPDSLPPFLSPASTAGPSSSINMAAVDVGGSSKSIATSSASLLEMPTCWAPLSNPLAGELERGGRPGVPTMAPRQLLCCCLLPLRAAWLGRVLCR